MRSLAPVFASLFALVASSAPAQESKPAPETVKWNEIVMGTSKIKFYGFLRLDVIFDDSRPNNTQTIGWIKSEDPAVFGRLGRSRPLAVHELEFAKTLTDKPVKVALPGPYLLTRTMWLECVSDRAYESRETLADDVVRVLREELHFLLAAGAALVQLDEPVLSEVVFAPATTRRSFMCGALSDRREAGPELDFARELIGCVVEGVPRERTALHMCRGNWTKDESAALSGGYEPLLPLLASLPVGTLFLELCTPRAGEMETLRSLPEDLRIGVGVVNQKHERVESREEIAARVRRAVAVFGRDRVLLTPDCGFATFADNPVSSAKVAEEKLRAIVAAAEGC